MTTSDSELHEEPPTRVYRRVSHHPHFHRHHHPHQVEPGVEGKKPGLFRRLLNEFEGKERVRDGERDDDGAARRNDRDEREERDRGRRRDASSEAGDPDQG